MGRYKEDIQDSITRQMEKAARKFDRQPGDRQLGDLTLAEQLKKREKYDKMSDEQKRAATPINVWQDYLSDFMVNKKKVTTRTIFNTISTKYSNELRDFHEKGVHFNEIIPFIEEKTSYLTNR